jgi:hypothetical protein
MGAWPPVVPDGTLIEPLAELAACTPHSASSAAADGAPEPDPGEASPSTIAPTNGR